MEKIREKRHEKGITFVALVITIVILLILAGVSISTVIGDNGIIKKAQESANLTKENEAKEVINRVVLEYDLIKSEETLEEFLQAKVPDRIDSVIDNGDGTLTISKNNYTLTVKNRTSNASKEDDKTDNKQGELTLSDYSGEYTYPVSGTFTVSGNTGALSVSSNNNNIATVSVSGNTVTVKPGTTAGKATITVTSVETSNYTAKSATYEATVNNGTINLSATPYTGTYDGKAHNTLTNVSVNPSDAKIEYSTDEKTFSATMPTITNASSITVTVRASKAGYTTVTTKQTARVNKATGTLTLSATSGTYTYPNSGTFTVSGNTGALSVSSNNNNIATVSVSGNTVTVKPGTTAGKATITVTSAEASNYTAKSATYEATVNNGTINLSATPYTGTYDGKAHNTLTNVSVNPSDAKIEYSTDEKTFSATMPTITNASSITVTVRASKAGYTTVTTKQTARVNKATGTLTLSATSGTYTYPNSGTFTVSGNTGALSVSSNNNNIATVSVSGNTVTVKPGTTAGKATITVTSAEASNYTAKSATYEATVNNGTISLSATPYTGTYDGKTHDALTNVSVNPSNAKIEYSTDGTTYSETMPTVIDTSSFTVTVRASKTGYRTQSTTQTVKVNKAEGKLTLSATSGILITSKDLTFTVEGNTGTLSVTSSDNSVATASINGNTVTVKSGIVAGQATITVMSTETNNYNSKSATFTVTAPKLNIIEENYTNINVSVAGKKIKEYKFSLDGLNWSQTQSNAEYSFTGLDKVVVNESNYEIAKSKEYNLYAMVKDDFDNTAVIGPIKGKTTIEVEAEAKNLEYKEENGEIIITGIKRDENEVQVGYGLNSDDLNKLINKTNVILIPSFIEGKPVRKISEKFVKETTTTLSSADEKIYAYVYGEKNSEDMIGNSVVDKNTYKCTPQLLWKNKTEVHNLYILYGNAYKIVKGLTANNSSTVIEGNYKIRNYKIVLPPCINEYVEEETSKTASNRGIVKISSRAIIGSRLKIDFEEMKPYMVIDSYVKLENPEKSDNAEFVFWGRNNLTGIANYLIFNRVINNAGNAEIKYQN